MLDTETTGLDPFDGHRIVEIGCIELLNGIPTGRVWHRHVNPEREVPFSAFEVHGLSYEFLRDKPRFAELADDMLGFIEGAMLVIHNAAFDFGFLNAELDRLARPPLRWDRVVDTLALARRKHPGRILGRPGLFRLVVRSDGTVRSSPYRHTIVAGMRKQIRPKRLISASEES